MGFRQGQPVFDQSVERCCFELEQLRYLFDRKESQSVTGGRMHGPHDWRDHFRGIITGGAFSLSFHWHGPRFFG